MQAIAGGAGEDGSACLLQREGRALAGAPARGSVSADIMPAAQSAPESNGSDAQAAEKAKEQQQLLQIQRAQAAMKEAVEARQHPRAVSLASGVSDGMGIDRSAPQPAEEALLSQEDTLSAQKDGAVQKDKLVLLAIECFPPCWLLGLDRFYLGSFRTGIAKVLLSIMTLSVGGFVWGLIDFSIIVVNALKRQEALRALGMEADFKSGNLQPAFVMGVIDILMLPVWVGLARYIWYVRKMARMERLKENAMKSPHFKAPATGTTIRGG